MPKEDGQFKKGNPGGGRPRKEDKHAGAIARAEKRIADRLVMLIDKQFELAEGVLVEEHTLDGKIIYKTPPNRQSIEYLINRIMGKPTERKELSGPDGDALNIVAHTPEQWAEQARQRLTTAQSAIEVFEAEGNV